MRKTLAVLWLAAWIAGAQTSKPVYRMETIAGSNNMGDGGPAIAAQMGNILGIAVDRLGNLYFSDTDNHRVRKMNTGGVITLLAGTGAPGFSGDGAPAAGAQLNLPRGLAADPNGNIYIADFNNNRVRRVGSDSTITTIAGTGDKGSGGDGGAATAALSMAPRDVALDAAGNLYISEFEGHRVRKVAPDGTISTAAGIGIAGLRGDGGPAVNAQLQYPAGLAFDRNGTLYIADSGNGLIRAMLPGGVIHTVLGNTPAISLKTPTSVAVDSAGTLYVGDMSGVVHAYTTAGAWTNAVAGIANALAVDSATLYIAEYMHIARLTGSGSLQVIAGDGYLHVGDGGSAVSAQLYQPSSIAFDTAGNLYIADTGTQRIRKVTTAGQIATVAGTGTAGGAGENTPAATAQLNGPAGVAADYYGDILIADTGNQRVREITVDGRIHTIAGTGNPGVGQEGQLGTQTPLNGPQAVCLDRTGTLYVVDTANNRVLRATPGLAVQTAAGNGTAGNAGDGGMGRLAELNAPSACAFNTAGDLFIADRKNNTVRKVSAAGIISTVAGTGGFGFAGDGGAATSALLNLPAGVAVDDSNLYIADTGNNRIRVVTSDGIIQTIAGSDDATPLRGPRGLLLDGSGNLYFAYFGNNLIRKLSPLASASLSTAPTPLLSIVSAASLVAGPVAPGEAVAIFGAGLGPYGGLAGTFDASGILPTQLGGTQVLFDGVPAPLYFVQASQVSVQVPYTVAGAASTNVRVQYNGRTAGAFTVAVTAAQPALFSVIVNQDGSPNSQSEPAARNSIVTFYGTGEGLTDGPNLAGVAAVAPYPQPRLPITLTIGGMPAEILYAGSAPGLVGTLQINARVPGGFVPAGQASVQLTIGNSDAPALGIWLE